MLLNNLFQTTVLMEAKARIEHPEDMIFDHGLRGAQTALHILELTADQPQSVSVKFDGSPALVFGWRDGEFILTDKAGFSAKSYDGMTTSAQALHDMIMARKFKDTSAEAVQRRQAYAQTIARIYPILRANVPRDFEGFAQGDLMWVGKPRLVDGYWEFQPNKIKYRVYSQTDLGQQIADSSAGIVIHSVYGSQSDSEPQALRDAGSLGFGNQQGLVIVPHEIKIKQPLKLNPTLRGKLTRLIRDHAQEIDRFFNPLALSDQNIRAMPGLMKSFMAHKAGQGSSNFDTAAEEFLHWLTSSASKASMSMQQNVISWIDSNLSAYNTVWQIVQLLVLIKLDLKRQMDQQVGSVVSAQLDDAPGHEGFVSVTPEGIIKFVNRAEFMKKDDILTEQTADSTQSHSPPRVVFTYARMNPPTLGHRMLVDKMKTEAGADDYWVFLSHSRDPILNPLTWEQKVQFVKQIMKPHAAHVITDPSVKLLFKTFKWLYDQGYRDINMVVGSDRVADMTQSLQTWNSDEKRIPDGRDRVIVNVINAGQRDPDSDDTNPVADKPGAAPSPVADKPGAAPSPVADKPAPTPDPNQVKISAISGTKARKAVEDGDLPAFEKFTGLKGAVASELFKTVQIGMNTPKEKRSKLVAKEHTLVEAVPWKPNNNYSDFEISTGLRGEIAHQLFDAVKLGMQPAIKHKPAQITENDHRGGTIVKLRMQDQCARRLHAWCEHHHIPCLDPHDLHLTLIYSLRPVPELMALDATVTHLPASVKNWKILGEGVLTLELHSPLLNQMHDRMISMGAQHSWPDFIPHTSVHYKWDQPSCPHAVPDFDLVFEAVEVEPIDHNWSAQHQS